jgi:tripartite-type tricarboxylate transporter receptor subunit TctC
MWRVACAAAIVAGVAAAPASADESEDFFKGKTLTYVVATSPGGGYDTYGRLIARYLEKHLPVSKVIVKNVPGAGHIVGANTIHAAEPDGLTIGSFNTGLVYAQLLGLDGVQFDLHEMSWIGKAASDTRSLVLGRDSGFADFDAFAAAKAPVKLASPGVGSAAYNDTKILAAALNLNVEVIPGFDGTEGEMSILRGEVAGQVGTTSSLRPFVANGHGFYALEIGGDGSSGTPQAVAYAKDDKARALLALVEAQGTVGRLTAGPPGIPEGRLARLRQAYVQALADPELLAEAKKLDIPIAPADGAQVATLIETALAQSPETIALLRDIMAAKAPTVSVKTELLTIEDGGKKVTFQSGSETVTSNVSGSRTQVEIDGKAAERTDLKAGMACEIEYEPSGEFESKIIRCGG